MLVTLRKPALRRSDDHRLYHRVEMILPYASEEIRGAEILKLIIICLESWCEPPAVEEKKKANLDGLALHTKVHNKSIN